MVRLLRIPIASSPSGRWLALTIASLMPLLASRAQDDSDSARVIVTIDASYDDSQYSLDQLDASAPLITRELDSLPAGGTLDQLIARRYGVTETRLPKTYAFLKNEIATLNGFKDPNRVPAGPLLVPALPPSASTAAAPTFSYQAYMVPAHRHDLVALDQSALPPNIALRSGAITDDAMRIPIVTARPHTNEIPSWLTHGAMLGHATRPLESVAYSAPVNVVRRLFTNHPSLARAANVRYADEQLTIQLAVSDPTQDPPYTPYVVPDADAVLIRRALTTPRQSPLFVLDECWPTDAAYHASINQIKAMLTAVRSKIATDAPLPPVSIHEAATVPPLPIPDLTSNSHHCSQIDSALAPFAALDATSRIQIVYVPVTRVQDDDDLVRTVLETDVEQVRAAEGFVLQGKDVSQASDSAKTYLRWVKQGTIDGASIHSSKRYVEALLRLFATYGDSVLHAPYAVSMSWFKAYDILDFAPPPISWAIPVAAVGNVTNEVVDHVPHIELAWRSTVGGEMLAALNIGGADTSTQCHSSLVDVSPQRVKYVRAFGFDGAISSRTCATSFSTPRVAWLLLLRELSRTIPATAIDWRHEFSDKVTTIWRHGPNAGLGALRLDVATLLQ